MADHALATITNPSAALTDFSLIVDLSRMPASWWSAVTSTDGTRGRVYKGDGTTRLAADWIDFDDTAETGLLRVLWSGTLATTGTQELWIEPPVSGNAAVLASDTYGSDNAYATSVEAYYPLQSDGNDRTSNNYDLTAVGTPTYVAGAVGNAAQFNGSSQYFTGAHTSISAFPASILGYVNHTNEVQVGEESPFGIFDASDSGTWFSIELNNEQLRVWTRPSATFTTTGADYADGVNHSVVGTAVGNNPLEAKLYVDGSIAGSGVGYNELLIANCDTISIGRRSDSTPNAYWDGAVSHVEIHSIEVSSAYAGQFDAMMDQSTFWGTWSWETSGGGTTYSVSASDGISLSDSPSGALTLTASVSDGVSFADSSGGASTIPLTVADAIVLSDEVLTAFTFGVQASDGVTLSDQATEGGVIQVTASDGIVFADSASAVLRLLAEISDGVTFSDETSATGTISATVSDGVTFSDAVTTALRVVASVSDGVRLSDVAIDSTFLPVGRVQIRVTTAQASVTITAKQPGVSVAFE